MIRESKLIKKFSTWYFGKKVLPYWVILLMDTSIVFVSAVFTYWVTNRTQLLFDNRFAVLCTALLYALLSWLVPDCSRPTRVCCGIPARLS